MNTHSHESVSKPQGGLVVSAKTFGVCLSLIAIALIALFVFKVPVNTLLLGGVLLACPLLHFWMMRDGEHGRTMKDGEHKH
ncbi:hypothetical protein A3A52_05020 [Candidatus Woesebacteria bacterium RIFCSPLOWO2_01_FULL_39_14]|uniref:DUF2933 domain-containing protein n=1 Tax=Candidatus Woesebacteria bacterium RIFCSPLOWO2_01_FULL_39_14 TaxID=1802518 RepID=A0A1F8BIX7_9BACT|nr:MAG: hypothetical protein A3A52_05020 [Candidatus Woesebacteria bacterium RIFCSPLOWO2_01_FULL_39_14]